MGTMEMTTMVAMAVASMSGAPTIAGMQVMMISITTITTISGTMLAPPPPK